MTKTIGRVGVALATLVLAVAVFAQSGAADLKFTVVRDTNGKPVRNASVILHPLEKDGRQGKGGLQLKTNEDGLAKLEAIPHGRMRIQVIARGFQTFGEDYDINKDRHEITIRLKPPAQQYSIYDNK